jgi:hypothetical protein
MKCKLITTASNYAKTENLRKSLLKYGWEYHIIIHEWKGFGGKILETYKYLKNNPDINYFFYSDSYDTLAFQTMEFALSQIEDKDCILMSAERACYPHPHKEPLYPKHESPWHFVNGGGWFCNSELFIKAVDDNPLSVDEVDQVWFTDLFLNNPNFVKLDYNCNVFQTIAFCPESDSEFIGQNVRNTITNTYPTFIHGNGHTPLDRYL